MTFWYQTEENAAHSVVFSTVASIEQEQSDVHRNNRDYARLYSNREEPGLTGVRGTFRSGYAAITENIVQSVVDTATSLIGKNRPKVTILTDDGDWELHSLARKLDRYLWGLFRALNIHDKMGLVFRDACVFGTGVLKVFERNGKIHAERVLIDEIVVDESEVPNGGELPREMHQIRILPRETVMKQFPEFEEEIRSSGVTIREFVEQSITAPDLVLVVESWQRACIDGNGKKIPGRHTICVENATLHDEPYTREYFPFVFYRWNPPLTGFYGMGLVEGLLGFQIRLNELNDFIRRCQDLVAVPRVAVEHGTKIHRPQITNEIGAVLSYIGKPPIFMTPKALDNEIYLYKESVKNSAFEFAGISKMAAHATRPEGIEAAVALRELSDNQSQRFSIQQQRYEDAHLDVGKMILRLSCEMYRGKENKVPFLADDFVETIPWAKADIDKEKFALQVQASSILGETPAGRLQRVTEMAQYGVQLDQATLVRLLDLPDVRAEDRRMMAQLEHAEWVVDRLLDGEYVIPEPFFDLMLYIDRAIAGYLDAYRAGAYKSAEGEAVLELFRRFISEAEATLREAMEPQVDPMAAGMSPEMMGAPPPEAPIDASLAI